MLPSLSRSRFARALSYGSSTNTVAEPIAQPTEHQNVEGQHATAHQRKILRESAVVLGSRHAPGAQSALDGSGERVVDQRGDQQSYGRAGEPRIRYRDHGVSPSSR